MPDNTDLNFGIENTMELGSGGVGNISLLNDLLETDIATAAPETIEKIETPPAPATTTDKTSKPAASIEANPNSIADFLAGEGEEIEEEEGTKKPVAVTPPIKEETAKKGEEDETPIEGTQFEALAKDLFSLGVFQKEEDEEEEAIDIKTPEAFLERFKEEKRKGAIEMVDQFLGQYGQDYHEAFEAIFVKGMNPREYYSVAAEIEDFSTMDLTKESNQEMVIRTTLQQQGFEKEDIEGEIEKLKNYGDLGITAERHHKVLVKKQSQLLAQKQAEAQARQQEKLNMKQNYINNVTTVLNEKIKQKEFDGIPLNPKLANELQDFLLVDKWKTATGETLTDFDRYILDLKRPENHANKVKVALLLKLLEKDPTLSTIQKSGVSKKTDALFQEVSRQVTKTPGSRQTSTSGGAGSWWKQ